MKTKTWFPLLAFLALVALGRDGVAQKLRDKTKPKNDPVQCPYCLGDPELMQASGVVSHGGFEFARETTTAIDEFYSNLDIKWIESKHYEIGIGIGTYKLPQKERDKFRSELTELSLLLPAVNPKEKNIDPWLRAHIYVMRAEKLWDQMLAILKVDESVFPDGRTPWNMTGTYWGEGPYLGQKGKYEVLFLPSETVHRDFLNQQFGLRIKRTQRYNVIERDSLILIAHTQQEGLRDDEALHGHFVFNQTILFLNGYKHYSYDSPVWLLEGMGHWMERNVNPKFNSFDASEGAAAQTSRKENWEPPARKLVSADDAPTMAQLVALKRYADFDLDDHYTTWSIVDYLMKVHPDFLAQLIGGLKGITDERGIADGSSIENVHRDLFKAGLGMSYAQFDRAWRDWVTENYSSQ